MNEKPIPSNLLYTKEHEWALVEGEQATVGITEHAQSQLGDVVYVELPSVGQQLAQHQTFGVVESVKAVSDLFCPFSGTVIEVNDGLKNHPEKINENAYEAWMFRMHAQNIKESENLMDAKGYQAYLQALSK